jgi:hypothetical protein
MVYTGRVQNGVIVLDEATALPEGTEVRVEPVGIDEPKTHYELFRNVIGKAEGLPPDMAENHDHYIHGAPNR